MGKWRVTCWLFDFIYQRWLGSDWRAIHVKGWRSALCENKYGMRRGITPCFWIFQ